METENKYTFFSKQLESLLKRLKSMESNEKFSDESHQKLFVGVESFYQLFNKGKAMDEKNGNFEYTTKISVSFEKLLARYCNDIYRTAQDDRWIKTSGIFIKPSQNSDNSKFFINLSELYLLACELRTQVDSETNDEVDEKLTPDQLKDRVRPTAIILHLLRIFYCLASEDSKKVIGPNVSFFEDKLRIPDNARTVPRPKQQGGMGNTVAGVLNGVMDMCKGMGLDVGENKIQPENINEMIGSVKNNPNVNKFVTDIFASLSNNGVGLAEVTNKAVTDLTESYPGFVDTLAKSGIPVNMLQTQIQTITSGGVHTPPDVVEIQKRIDNVTEQ